MISAPASSREQKTAAYDRWCHEEHHRETRRPGTGRHAGRGCAAGFHADGKAATALLHPGRCTSTTAAAGELGARRTSSTAGYHAVAPMNKYLRRFTNLCRAPGRSRDPGCASRSGANGRYHHQRRDQARSTACPARKGRTAAARANERITTSMSKASKTTSTNRTGSGAMGYAPRPDAPPSPPSAVVDLEDRVASGLLHAFLRSGSLSTR